MTKLQEMVLCDSCGAASPHNAKQCVGCGEPLAPRTEKIQPTTAKVIGVLLFLTIGIVAESFMFAQFQRARASPTWPTVEGTMILHKTSGANGSYFLGYAYSVDGTNYVGRKVTYKNDQNVRYNYKEYQVITVYYAPDNPGIAVLRPGYFVSDFVVPPIMTFAVFFLIPFWQIIVIMKIRARNHELIRTGKLTIA